MGFNSGMGLPGDGGVDLKQVVHTGPLRIIAEEDIGIGIRLGAHDLFGSPVKVIEQIDSVVLRVDLALAHLLGGIVKAHHARANLADHWLRHDEGLAKQVVEALGQIARKLQVLALIFTHRHLMSLV